MKMKKVTFVSWMLAVITFCVSTLASAEGGVNVDNIRARTTITGAVTQFALGNGNDQSFTAGGVSGNVQGKSIDTETTITGAVTQGAIGNDNTQSMNLGGVTSRP